MELIGPNMLFTHLALLHKNLGMSKSIQLVVQANLSTEVQAHIPRRAASHVMHLAKGIKPDTTGETQYFTFDKVTVPCLKLSKGPPIAKTRFSKPYGIHQASPSELLEDIATAKVVGFRSWRWLEAPNIVLERARKLENGTRVKSQLNNHTLSEASNFLLRSCS